MAGAHGSPPSSPPLALRPLPHMAGARVLGPGAGGLPHRHAARAASAAQGRAPRAERRQDLREVRRALRCVPCRRALR
eukprot:6074156-Prymnesium_polylepis.1